MDSGDGDLGDGLDGTGLWIDLAAFYVMGSFIYKILKNSWSNSKLDTNEEHTSKDGIRVPGRLLILEFATVISVIGR